MLSFPAIFSPTPTATGAPSRSPMKEQQEAIEQVKACRGLADELRLLLDEARNDA